MWYNTVKRYYDNGHPLYNDNSLKGFVFTRMITEEEYKLITGIEYIPA